MEHAAHLISALGTFAWPASVLAALIFFRRSIRSVLDRASHLKAGPFEAWDDRLAEARRELADEPARDIGDEPQSDDTSAPTLEDLALCVLHDLTKLIDNDSAGAVIEAYERLRAELREHLRSAVSPGVLLSRTASATTLAETAHRHGLIRSETVDAIAGITTLRNLAAHRPEAVTPSQALDFLVTTDSILWTIRQNVRSAIRRG